MSDSADADDEWSAKLRTASDTVQRGLGELDARLYAIEFMICQLVGEASDEKRQRIIRDTKEWALSHIREEDAEKASKETRAVLRLLHPFLPNGE